MLARHPNHQPITQIELVGRTLWPMKKVQRFCGLGTWRNVPVVDADTWRIACNITRATERRAYAYLKRTLNLNTVTTSFIHFRKRPAVATARMLKIIKNQKKHLDL